MDADDAGHALHQLINGYRISQAIHVAASLRVADQLIGGPKTVDNLAVATGSHAGALYRLLRALAATGVLHESNDRTFALTPIGQHLRSDVAGSRQAWANFSGQHSFWEAWGQLLHSVRTGENAFKHTHGTDVWGYRARNPAECEVFDLAMREGSLRAFEALAASYDFGQFGRIADIGGGDGSFLASILKAHHGCSGVLFDQPHVVAAASDVLLEAGVAARCEVIGGNFLECVPQACDAYVLKFILHDWEDDQAVLVLRACRRAVGPSSKLIIIERVLGPANEGLEGKFSDLNMLVSAGGRERTLEEFEALFERSGLATTLIVQRSGQLAIIEAGPA